MKFEIEPSDIQAIANRVLESLKPVLSNIERREDKDIIFDVKGLAKYLCVDPSWVYKQISLGTVPHFKAGKYSRFKRKDIDRWIESNTVRPTSTLKLLKSRG